MDEERISKVAEEAAKILKDYPQTRYVQAIQKAKEVLGYEKSNKGNQVS